MILFVFQVLCLFCFGAQPVSFLESPYDALWDEAVSLQERGDDKKALIRVRAVRRRYPGYLPALIKEGNLLVALQRPEEALSVLESNPYEPNAIEQRVRIYLTMGETKQALKHVSVLEDMGWTAAWLLRAQALTRSDPEAAAEVLMGALENVEGQTDLADLETAVHTVVVAVLDIGQVVLAQQVLDAALPKFGVLSESVRVLEDRVEIEAQAQWLRFGPAVHLTGLQIETLGNARRLRDTGQHRQAIASLNGMGSTAGRNADVLSLKAELHVLVEEYEQAVEALQQLERISPLDATPSLRLGELLEQQFPAHLEPTWAAYHRATKKEPTRSDLWNKKGRVEVRMGRLDAAVISLERARQWSGSHEASKSLEALIARYRRSLDIKGPVKREDGCHRIQDPKVCATFYRSMAHFYRADQTANPDVQADWEHALTLLDTVQKELEAYPPSWNLRGAICLGRAQATNDETWMKRAVEAYERSLAISPRQPKVLTLLGVFSFWKGNQEGAVEFWQRAIAFEGDDIGEAHLYLAEDSFSNGQIWSARRHLKAGFSKPITSALHARAVRLQGQVDRIIYSIYTVLIAFSLFTCSFFLFRVKRRRMGMTVEEFLSAFPDAFSEVSETCAAIRHEVVKHNTTLLPQAISANFEQMAVIERNVFGERGAITRFKEYLQRLNDIAQRRGVRLNLRYRDPIFSHLIDSMHRLETIGVEGLGMSTTQQTIETLAHRINRHGFDDLGHLIERQSEWIITMEWIRGIWEGVLGEPKFLDSPSPALIIASNSPQVRVYAPQGALEDIFGNLLRNAASMSLDSVRPQLWIGWMIEEDPITYHRTVAVRVADQIDSEITTEMIRSRYITRGLGIVNQVVQRLNGSVSVESQPDYAKAIVVRIPMKEMN